jgi:SAM-dependent methyltransferase
MILSRLGDPTRAPFSSVLRNPGAYRRWLEHRYPRMQDVKTPVYVPAENGVLLTHDEIVLSTRVVREAGLPEYSVAAKNWDSLGAYGAILGRTTPEARVLDAGGIMESVILTWLWLAGYRDLWCINPVYARPFRHAAIRYEPGDATATRFPDEWFDAITCLSVVEHGVDLAGYFREAARILKTGGVLITSTDYFSEPIDVRGARAYGTDVKIFTRTEIEGALVLAATCGLVPTGPVPLESDEKPVHWERTGLDYTFVMFTLVKER